MAEMTFTEADAQSLSEELSSLSLSQGEAAALAALAGGELSQSSDVEPYIYVKAGPVRVGIRVRTPFGTITSARRPS